MVFVCLLKKLNVFSFLLVQSAILKFIDFEKVRTNNSHYQMYFILFTLVIFLICVVRFSLIDLIAFLCGLDRTLV